MGVGGKLWHRGSTRVYTRGDAGEVSGFWRAAGKAHVREPLYLQEEGELGRGLGRRSTAICKFEIWEDSGLEMGWACACVHVGCKPASEKIRVLITMTIAMGRWCASDRSGGSGQARSIDFWATGNRCRWGSSQRVKRGVQAPARARARRESWATVVVDRGDGGGQSGRERVRLLARPPGRGLITLAHPAADRGEGRGRKASLLRIRSDRAQDRGLLGLLNVPLATERTSGC